MDAYESRIEKLEKSQREYEEQIAAVGYRSDFLVALVLVAFYSFDVLLCAKQVYYEEESRLWQRISAMLVFALLSLLMLFFVSMHYQGMAYYGNVHFSILILFAAAEMLLQMLFQEEGCRMTFAQCLVLLNVAIKLLDMFILSSMEPSFLFYWHNEMFSFISAIAFLSWVCYLLHAFWENTYISSSRKGTFVVCVVATAVSTVVYELRVQATGNYHNDDLGYFIAGLAYLFFFLALGVLFLLV